MTSTFPAPAVPQASGLMPAAVRDGVDVTRLAASLWRRRWRAGVMTLLGAALGFVWADRVAIPRFDATAVLVLTAPAPAAPQFDSVLQGFGGSSLVLNTELEVLRAKSLLGGVADDAGLVHDAEFNAALRGDGLIRRLWAQAAAHWDIPPFPLPAPPAETSREAVVAALADGVSVTNVPDSYVFEVTVRTQEPEKSASLANRIVESYIAGKLAAQGDASSRAIDWLTGQVTALEDELRTAEAATQAFNASIELISPEALAGMSRQHKATRARIAEIEAEILAEPGNARSLKRSLGQLEASASDLKARIERQSADLLELQQLSREAAASRLVYEHFLARLKEAAAQQALDTAEARFLTRAEPPEEAATPQPVLTAAMAGLVSLLLSVAGVLRAELANATFLGAEDIEERTGLRVAGQVLMMRERRRDRLPDELVANPSSAAAEAIRSLRTAVFAGGGRGAKRPNLVMVTSSLPGEGKTTTALALATNCAGLGARTLLVEGDMRRRILAGSFGRNKAVGLADVLMGRATPRDAAHRIEAGGFDLLAGRPAAANAGDLLTAGRLETAIAEMRQEWDVVIFDLPPVLSVPDALIAARAADVVLFAIGWNRTRTSEVALGLQSFRAAGVAMPVAVLTQVDARRLRRLRIGGAGAYFGNGYAG